MKLNTANLTINKGVPFSTILEYKENSVSAFTDFTDFVFKAQFRTSKVHNATLIATATITKVGLGQIKLALTDAQTALFPGTTAYYDVLCSENAGDPELIFTGTVTVTDVCTQWENVAPTTTCSVASDASITTSTDITLTANEVGAVIYYTVDGSTPTTASTVYTTAFNLTAGTKAIKFFAVDTAGNVEAVKTVSNVTVA